MRTATILLVSGLLALALASVGCDTLSSSTEPTIKFDLNVDFRCRSGNGGLSLSCTDQTTGGARPYFYTWKSEFQAPQTGIDKSEVSFNYQDECEGEDELLVSVTLEILDDDRKRDSASDVFVVCR